MQPINRIAAAIVLVFYASTALADVPGIRIDAAVNEQVFDLETEVTRAMKVFDVPGIAIAIVKDGKVISARGFGVRKLGEAARVDGKTIFEIASNSKAFTAAALAILVDEGKLGWDDPVTKHLPDFQMYDAYVTREMTIRDLLVHRSGLGLGAGDLLWWPTTDFSTDEIIHKLRYIRPATSFRSAYAYDNLLYIVAGKIITLKSGKPWGETMRERILSPLGMNMTTTSYAENFGNLNLSSPHSKIEGKTSVVRAISTSNAVGAAGINSNAEDMARWMTVLLAGGVTGMNAQGKEVRLFSEAQSNEIFTPQTPIKISKPKPALASLMPNFSAYGLGFQLRDYKGHKLVTHSGVLQGFISRVIMVPDANLGIAILTNAESYGAPNSLYFRILDHYLGGSAPDWIKQFKDDETEELEKDLAEQKKLDVTRAVRSLPSLPLASYDGDYEDVWYGKVSIKAVGNKRVMSFSKTADLTGELSHFQYDTFIVRWKDRNLNADAYVSFSLNPDGSIERMKMAPISSETDFSYDFADLTFIPVSKSK